ncbi:centrosomal protein of 164 kDa isoform X3 [Ahaetulla prasina]|uniref:centrosomal protein of 164 kDa isoform X3 n=1 Tax=Ahaetulla prasina TaxID=499056 RepID=UPI0026486745|nr:centrosomal protein of 164 kDa isoform X3 [Ahaetulla prasina]
MATAASLSGGGRFPLGQRGSRSPARRSPPPPALRPPPRAPQAMAGPALRIGDQLILEEDYDDSYIPSEREIQEFARVVGIDPEHEPELMWLAREGIVAPLPAEWKPCQDITGDIYYFNFANGQSTWDHPCDERYRQLVIQEREKILEHGGLKKKEKKKKKAEKKKDKKERDPSKHSVEMQSEPGILPSTSFYRVSSPILYSEHGSPDLEQPGSLVAQNDSFLKNPKGKFSDAGDLSRLLSSPAPGKLQPLLPEKSNRAQQILADVEKILGRNASFSRSDVNHQAQQDANTEIGCAAASGVLSDLEAEDVDSIHLIKPFFQTLKKPSHSTLAGAMTVLALGGVKEKKLLLEGEKQGEDRGKGHAEGDGLVRKEDFLQSVEKEMQLSPSAAASTLISSRTLEGQGDIRYFQNEVLRPLERIKENRRRKKNPSEQGQATESSPWQIETLVPHSQLQGSVELGAKAGISESEVSSPTPGQLTGRKKHDSKIESDSGNSISVASSLSDHLASQVLGEVDNLSWDLQSSCESEHPTKHLPSPQRPFLEAVNSQAQSSPDNQSASECYSEDQKFYQHVLHMVQKSRRTESGVAKSLEGQKGCSKGPGSDQTVQPDVAGEGTTEMAAVEAAATPEGEKLKPCEGQACLRQDNQAGEQLGPKTVLIPKDGDGIEEPSSCGKNTSKSKNEEEKEACLPHLISDVTEKKEVDENLILEKVLDPAEIPPVLNSPKFGVNRATFESTSKEEDKNWLAQEKNEDKDSLEEEQNSGSAMTEESRQFETEINPIKPWNVHTEELLEKITKVEETNMYLLEEKQIHIQNLQEELQQREEEEIQMLHQQKESALQLLKTELETTRQEEEIRLREEIKVEFQKLHTELNSEMDAGKEKISLAQEAALNQLKEELESFQQQEREKLQKQKWLSLERIKKEAEMAEQAEQMALEQENQRALDELREKLCREKELALQELQVQLAADIQQQKNAAAEDHQKVILTLQMEIMEAQRREKAELQKALENVEQNVQQKRHQVAEYERELSDLLKEKRQEVEHEHARELEKMQKIHQEALARIQMQHEDKEKKQKVELLARLQDELEHMELLHKAQQEALRKTHMEDMKELRQKCQEQEKKAQDAELELELRAKDAQTKAAQLCAQEEAWKKKRQQVLEEEKQLEEERHEAALAAHSRLEESQKAQENLEETLQQLHSTLAELQDQKIKLESQVELLQIQSQQLERHTSELEETIRTKQELLKKLDKEWSEAISPREKEEALRMEDLQGDGPEPSSREMTSEIPKSNEENSLLNQVRHYISSEGASLKTAKEFLLCQTRSMRKRRTALRAAKQHWYGGLQGTPTVQDSGHSQVLEGVRRNLEEEGRQLDEMKSAMRKGQELLKKKEERLSQLESSLLEEFSDEDTIKGVACKKMVTFDLNDSEDTSSLMSADQSLHKTADLKLDVQFSPFDKIQYLTESLQRITSDLNCVLHLLSNFSSQQTLFASTQGQSLAPLARDGIPLTAYTSLARAYSATSFAPSAGLQSVWCNSGPGSATVSRQSVDNMLMEKWRKYFPGKFPLPCGGLGAQDDKLDALITGFSIPGNDINVKEKEAYAEWRKVPESSVQLWLPRGPAARFCSCRNWEYELQNQSLQRLKQVMSKSNSPGASGFWEFISTPGFYPFPKGSRA